MVKDELIDEHVSLRQCIRAVDALLSHASKVAHKKAESELLPDKEQHVWLMVTVKQMQPEKKLKPFKIPIAHPIVDPRVSSVCLITKDPQREYKDLLESNGIRFISRVVGVEKLKGKFKPFEARRLLLKENDLFLADERVVPLLPGLLGKKFFQAKKQPIPVCLTRKDLKGELERAISSTYFHQNQGTCTSVKIGTVSQSSSKVMDNLKAVLPAIVKRIKGEWDNVQSFYIKTNSSASLPIWTCDLGTETGARWDGLVAETESGEEGEGEQDDEVSEADEDGQDAPVKAQKKMAAADVPTPKTRRTTAMDAIGLDKAATLARPQDKGRKRATEDDNSEPQKKPKSDAALPSATIADPKTMNIKTPSSGMAKSSPAETPKARTRKSSMGTVDASTSPAPTSSEVQFSVTGDAQVAAESAEGAGHSKKRKKRKSIIDAETAVSEAPAAPPIPLTTVPVQAPVAVSTLQGLSTSEDDTAGGPTKKRKKHKAAVVDVVKSSTATVIPIAAPLAPSTPSQLPEEEGGTAPAKKRKRAKVTQDKSTTASTTIPATEVAEAPVFARASTTEAAEPKQKRRRGKAAPTGAGPSPDAVVVPPIAPLAAPEPAAKPVNAGVVDTPPKPATPVTPSVAKRKKKRAFAIDFFEDGMPATLIAVPPNTPAGGLPVATPSTASKKAEPVEVTPLRSALKKVASVPAEVAKEKTGGVVEEAAGTESSTATKRPKKRKSKATFDAPTSARVSVATPAPAVVTSYPAAPAQTTGIDAGTETKKVKRRKSKAGTNDTAASVECPAAPSTPVQPIMTPTKDELKKKRGTTGGEKKKEKALGGVPAAKSAKEAVVGKRRL